MEGKRQHRSILTRESSGDGISQTTPRKRDSISNAFQVKEDRLRERGRSLSRSVEEDRLRGRGRLSRSDEARLRDRSTPRDSYQWCDRTFQADKDSAGLTDRIAVTTGRLCMESFSRVVCVIIFLDHG